MQLNTNTKICVFGLGYVGLPLAIEFSKHFSVVGYDLNAERIHELQSRRDSTMEVTEKQFSASGDIIFTACTKDLVNSNVYIVTVPTPVDENKRPDLSHVIDATDTISKILRHGDTVIYESTVFPGVSEEICLPILERNSGLMVNKEFFLGYSPERINPGDKAHNLIRIAKVTSGSNEDAAGFVDSLYKKIILAGTHKASSIKVAEAAKVIENTQRDLNIALINELAIIFSVMNIDTEEVIRAAETKWNFLGFRPGLVGGHCIGVDPYYLTFKAQQLGYEPEVILAGRRINDSMGKYIAHELVKMMLHRGINLVESKVLVLGLTFKENCSDIRNTKVLDVIDGLLDYSIAVDVYDPWVRHSQVKDIESVNLVDNLEKDKYQGVIVAVKHNEFVEMRVESIRDLCVNNAPIYDLKSVFDIRVTDKRL